MKHVPVIDHDTPLGRIVTPDHLLNIVDPALEIAARKRPFAPQAIAEQSYPILLVDFAPLRLRSSAPQPLCSPAELPLSFRFRSTPSCSTVPLVHGELIRRPRI